MRRRHGDTLDGTPIVEVVSLLQGYVPEMALWRMFGRREMHAQDIAVCISDEQRTIVRVRDAGQAGDVTAGMQGVGGGHTLQEDRWGFFVRR